MIAFVKINIIYGDQSHLTVAINIERGMAMESKGKERRGEESIKRQGKEVIEGSKSTSPRLKPKSHHQPNDTQLCKCPSYPFKSQLQIANGMNNELQMFIDELGDPQSLKWSSSHHHTLLSANSDFATLSKLKNVILSLRKDWGAHVPQGAGLDYEKRLQLAEAELDGLLKRRLNLTVKDQNGQRVLDYSLLLNEKENQIVELEKKVQNLQERLRRAYMRESELELHLGKLTEDVRRKEELAQLKHQSAVVEVANCTAFRDAFAKLRRNVDMNKFKIGELDKLIFEGVNIPEVGNFDIKSDIFSDGSLISRSRVYQQQTEGQKYRIRLAQFFREFQRLVNQSQGITDFEVERIIEGFLSNMSETKLYEKMQYSIDRYRFNQEAKRLRDNFAAAGGIFADFIAQLKRDNVVYRLPGEVDNIFALLQQEKVTAVQVQAGVFISVDVGKTVEVPVQDARTKHLLHLLAHELKGLFLRFPKLQDEIDPRLAQFLKQEIIDVMQADQIEKLVQIVKFVPQIIRVDNVYTNSTEKQRKVEFHLRVLIKALLEELEKVRAKTGVVLEMDEGVVGMIRSEIMDCVNVQDILKVFRVCPKIVEVQKIVEKIVDRIVEVPKVVTVEKIVEKIVEVQKIREVEKIVHVPVQKPMVVETQIQKLVPYQNRIQTIVEVPTIVEKLVQVQKQVARVLEVEVIKERIVEVEKPVEVERIVNHIQTEYQQVQVIVQRLVPVEKIIQKIVEVPVFVEKIVERVVEVPRIVQVQKIVEKIVPVIEYRSAREVQNHVEVKYQIIDRIVEKIVPVIHYRDRIKQVPQEIEVIRQVTHTVTEIKEVEVIRERIVIQEVIKQIPRVEIQLVEVIREVIKQVDRFIEIPIIREVAVIRELIVEKPVISRVESVHIKEVVIREPFIVREPTILQIEKFINVYVEVPKMVKYIQQKIVQVPTIVDRIKQVRVVVEKIVEKMVEVPRVVEVQRVVEKVVVVPRIVEKVVEVPQFVQKIVEKEVIREIVREVERIVHVPVIQQQVREVQVIKNVYIEIQKPIEKIVERTVQVPRVEEKIITKQVLREVPINLIHQVPRQIQVQKIVTQVLQTAKPVQVERQIIVPYEIPVPVDRIVQKVIPREQIIEKIVTVPQVMIRNVPVVQQVVELQEVQRIVQRIVVEKSIQEVERIVPYIQEVIKEVPTIIEKLVPVETRVEQIITAQQIIEKIIEKTVTVPQVYQVQRIREKLVQVPKLIEIQRVIPQIIRVNQYIQKIVEKIVEVPTIIETLKEVVREQEKVVQVHSNTTQILEVSRTVEKLVYAQKLKEVVRNVNYIQKVLQIIDRLQQVPVAVTTVQERLIQVPYILQKIVEKIILMPQIVEVLKYVHEVCQVESAGVAVDVEVGTHEARYREVCRNIEQQLDVVVKELRYLKSDQITRQRIEGIEKFLEELRKFILVPRIVKVVEERIVEKEVQVDRVVQFPTQDEKSLRMELSLGILVEKLIGQLRRLKDKTGAQLELDQDIRLIFFAELNSTVALDQEMQTRLKNYSGYVQRQFQSLGSWSTDHQLMLNSFLQERFLMAELIQNANFELEQAKAASQQRMEGLKRYRGDSQAYIDYLARISAVIRENRPASEIVNIVKEFDQYQASHQRKMQAQMTMPLQDPLIDSERIQSMLRQKDAEIAMLRDSLHAGQSRKQEQGIAQQEGIIKVLKAEIDSLRKENSTLLAKSSQNGLNESYRQQIADLQSRNFQLESEISRLRSQNYNQSNELKLMMNNISFKREPQASFQEIDLKETSRLQQSQSSQGRSLSGSQAQRGDTGNIASSIYMGKTQGGASQFKPQTEVKGASESKLSQSGTRNIQTPPVTNFDNVSLVKSGIYTTQAGQYPSYDSSLYQSQKRETGQKIEQVSQFGPGVSQSAQSGLQSSGVQRYQPDIKNFGVEESSGQIQGQGLRQSQTSGVYQAQSGIYQLQQSGVGSRVGSQLQTGPQGQSGVGLTSGISGLQASTQAYRQGGQTLYSSRQQPRNIPTTQPLYYEQGQPQTSRTYATGSSLYGSQAQGTTSQSSSIVHTPIQGLKYRSPSPKSGKLTESILKEQESLSKLEAQSPQVFKKEQGKGEYKYYYRPEKK